MSDFFKANDLLKYSVVYLCRLLHIFYRLRNYSFRLKGKDKMYSSEKQAIKEDLLFNR